MRGFAFNLVLVVLIVLLSGCKSNKKKKPAYSNQEVQEALLAYNKRLAENIHAEIDTFVANSEFEYKKADEGFYYTVLRKGNNTYPTEGDKISCTVTFKLLDGSLCYPEKSGEISAFVVGKHYLTIVNKSVQKTDEGGEIEVVVSPYLGFGLNGDGKKIPPARPYLLNISFLKVNNDAIK